MPSYADPIVAIQLTAGNRSGITLYAPAWEDADGEEWQGFLGDGAKIVLLGTVDELNTWLGDHPDHDLADHPAWMAFSQRGKAVLEPAPEARYDLDAVYELAAAEPDPETVSELADTVDIAARIADCCEDGMLRSLLTGTREYALLVEGETDYHTGKEGRAEWSALGSVVAESWERALVRVQSWLSWQGSSTVLVEEAEPADLDE
jgi:hypothetical protein